MRLAQKFLAVLVLVAVSMPYHGSAQASDSITDSITVGLHLEPPHLDPTGGAAAAIDQVLYANVFEGLTRFAEDGSIIPALAQSWQISADGTVYTFTLNQGVYFHDGTVMDAEDVKFSLDRARGDNSTNAQKALFSGITAVDILTPHQIQITLAEPNGLFLFNLAWGDAVIVNEAALADIRTKPVGTGAFMFERWQKGESITLARNPGYWGKSAPLRQVKFRFLSDPNAAYASIVAGDIDAFVGYPAPETVSVFAQDSAFEVVAGTTEGETILAINNAAPPFNDPNIRRAIAHGIDRQSLIDGAMFGYGTPIGSHFAPHHPDYIDLVGRYDYNPERARALLADAGLADGFDATLKLPPPSYARRGGEIIQAQLADIGIKLTIETLEWAQWLEEVFRNKDYDLTIISHTEPFDIGIYANPDYYFQYDSPDFQDLMARLGNSSDAEDRRGLSQQAQQMLADDAVNAFLFQLPQITVRNAQIRGMWDNAPTQAVDMTAVFWQP